VSAASESPGGNIKPVEAVVDAATTRTVIWRPSSTTGRKGSVFSTRRASGSW
jgi:hypothetical protein